MRKVDDPQGVLPRTRTSKDRVLFGTHLLPDDARRLIAYCERRDVPRAAVIREAVLFFLASRELR
jgi:hypothetical protein